MNDSDGRHIRSAARLLKAIANERRLSILCHLAQGEMCVGALVAAIGLSQSALSQHLARLRADGLVRTRRVGHSIVYALASTEAAAVIEVLQGLYCDGPPPDHSSALPSSPPETRT